MIPADVGTGYTRPRLPGGAVDSRALTAWWRLLGILDPQQVVCWESVVTVSVNAAWMRRRSCTLCVSAIVCEGDSPPRLPGRRR